MDAEVSAAVESRHAGQAEVVAESRFEGLEKIDQVTGAVVPVHATFVPASVRGVGFHGPPYGRQGPRQHLLGQLRIFVGDGEGPDAEAAVAHLVPVGAAHGKVVFFPVGRDPRGQPLGGNGPATVLRVSASRLW